MTKASDDQDKKFEIQHLYVKTQHFEMPNVPTVFEKDNWDPKNQFEIRTANQHIKDNLYEVTLSVKVTSETKGQKVFDCEITQAGLFRCEGFTEEQQKFLINASAPNVLYAYARKTLSDAVVNAGFPPMLLAPMNFEAIYAQEMEKRKQGDSSETEEGELIKKGEILN